MNNRKRFWAVLCLIALASASLLGQGKPYDGPTDEAGDPNLERMGKMTGNRVMITFKNNTELGEWPRTDVSRWPNNNMGTKQNDGVGLILGARVFLKDLTTPVTDTLELQNLSAQGLLDTLYYCQTNYREEMDLDPTGTIEWGFHPCAGYSNINAETPAMSNDPNSWPPAGWPARGFELKWPGEWNGRFGRGVIYADLECFQAANDAQDQEYLGDDDVVKYYPRPEHVIGELRPDISVQKGLPWGGLGLRAELRGFQWDNAHARDAIFWEYNVANLSDYDLPQMTFGYWVDNNIGGTGAGEDGYFLKPPMNLSYAWSRTGKGTGGIDCGIQGFAFLESPGVPNDGRDNDVDGLTDERRDNDAGTIIGALDGITNLTDFLLFYGVQEADLKEHYSGDEDQDWNDGIDANSNGIYEFDEYAGDDVGTDGVGPADLNYAGPDADGSECDHKPSYTPGIGSEPNFAMTDISESDMLGLTTFRMFPIPAHTPPYTSWFRNDQSMWEISSSDSFTLSSANLSNLGEIFACGVFPLYQGQQEHISLAELHSYEDLTGLKSADHPAPALFTLKKTVQLIYDKDYRFAQPPIMPTLTAIPGDGMVTLMWDDISDKSTREPLLSGVNDFEGYKLYRATDKFLSDPYVVTDGYGTPTFRKPIFQCDKVNGISGFTDFALKDGAGYYLGSDNGLTHSFVDSTVENGRTYYYALAAYDYGISPENIKSGNSDAVDGIMPSENNAVVELDEAETITKIGRNVAIVTPGVRPAGTVIDGSFTLQNNEWLAEKGVVNPVIALPEAVKSGHTYKVKFSTYTLPKVSDRNKPDAIADYEERGKIFTANGMYVYDVTGGTEVRVLTDATELNSVGVPVPGNIYSVMTQDRRSDRTFYHLPNILQESDMFDGLRLEVRMDSMIAAYDPVRSGWLTGNAPIHIAVPTTTLPYAPWDYYIVFTSETYTDNVNKLLVTDETGTRLDKGEVLSQIPLPFKVENRYFPPDPVSGLYERMPVAVHDKNKNGVFDMLGDRLVVGVLPPEKKNFATVLFVFDFLNALDESELPQVNDVYKVTYMRPFTEQDSVLFTVNLSQTIEAEQLKADMQEIKVVPNPYVSTNMMEQAVANTLINQDRRIVFTHIPAQCVIKIFTVGGILVDEIHAPADGLASYSGMGDYNTGSIHWDLKSKEGLEVAAGMYIYHVKDDLTGKEKIGKFAIIK
jgi:hypothetical protein